MVNEQLLPRYLTPEGNSVYCNPTSYYVALDFETTNLDKGSPLNPNNRLVLACWELVYPDGTIIPKHQWGDEYDMQELEKDINGADFVVAHNAKFELQWLRRCGLELRDILVFDTMLAEWVIAGNRKWDLSLDGTSKRYKLGQKLSLAAMAISLGVDTPLIPRDWLLPYCYRDVELCRKLYEQQIQVLVEDGLLHLALTRNLTCACLADIEFSGAELDQEAVLKEYTATIEEFHESERELEKYTGGINLSSGKQLAEYLFDKIGFKVPKDHKGNDLVTAKGQRKTDVNTLALLKPSNKVQEGFLALYKRRNKLDSLLSKNLEFFRLVCEQHSGRFMAILNQGFTQTHRLSSSGKPILFAGLKRPKGVQGQNIPREYKRLFTAHQENYLVGEADGAQLEFRVGAELGHDKVATQEIIDGVDIHSFTMKVLTEAGQPVDRQGAKPQTFQPLFWGRGKTKAENEYAEFFWNKYHEIYEEQSKWIETTLEQKWFRTAYGMKFYFPDTKLRGKSGWVTNSNSIANYPIQGFATGEIIPIALVHFWHRIRGHDIIIWLTIHDSVASRLHESELDFYREASKISLTTDVYNYLREVYNYEFSIPLGVGLKVGKNWGKAPFEEIWDVYPDGTETYKRK